MSRQKYVKWLREVAPKKAGAAEGVSHYLFDTREIKSHSDRRPEVCPFCNCDPYEYVDIGVGMQPVAVVCCNLGIALFAGIYPEAQNKAQRLAKMLEDKDPRRRRRAKRIVSRMM